MLAGDPGPGFDEQAFLPQNLPSAFIFLTHHSFSSLASPTVIQGATSNESRKGYAFISSTHTVTELQPYYKLLGSQLPLGKIRSCSFSLSGLIIIYNI